MPFEWYSKQRVTSDKDEVSISSAGIITISVSLTKDHLENVKYVELGFDPTTKRIAIKPSKTETRTSLQLLRVPNSRRTAISGRGFLRFYKIAQSGDKFKPATFPAKFEDGMIIFSVK